MSPRPRRDFPYEDGDIIVLGPEVFAAKDRSLISWQGENFYPRRTAMPGPDPRNIRTSREVKRDVRPIPRHDEK